MRYPKSANIRLLTVDTFCLLVQLVQTPSCYKGDLKNERVTIACDSLVHISDWNNGPFAERPPKCLS
jgi:hypothetical protein